MSDQTLQQRFVAAWGEIENPELDGTNPHFKNKYATLKATLRVIREACKAHGIAYMQRLERQEEGYTLKSSVTDGADSMGLSEFPLDTPPNPQSFGSNLTYTKRQQAQADWCITGEEDDDGNAAAEAAKAGQNRQNRSSAGNAAKQPPNQRQGASGGESNVPNDGEKRKKLWHEIGELKEKAIGLGISEAGITSWIASTYKNKDMKDMNLTEVLGVRGYLITLITDKESLMSDKEKA